MFRALVQPFLGFFDGVLKYKCIYCFVKKLICLLVCLLFVCLLFVLKARKPVEKRIHTEALEAKRLQWAKSLKDEDLEH